MLPFPTFFFAQGFSAIEAGMAPKTTMEAAISNQSSGYHPMTDVPKPALQPGTMLVRVHAVALNHYDSKIVEFGLPTPGPHVGGCDFAGVVVASGPGTTRFRVGDRVLAFNTHGGFAEYALAVEDLSCHIPDDMQMNEACSLGMAIGVAGLALFQEPGLNLPLPERDDGSSTMKHSEDENSETTTVLISGGASVSGTMATQLLKLSVLAFSLCAQQADMRSPTNMLSSQCRI